MDVAAEPHRFDDARTPTATHFNLPPNPQHQLGGQTLHTATEPTPTRDSFSLSEKRPLSPDKVARPGSSQAPGADANEQDLNHQESLQSLKSTTTQGSNTTNGADEDAEGSDHEGQNASYRPQKKKKSQKFYCTDYPPCNLSFTRSEHLARHIRKHTGERPFQCHCLRRFSRLDNLRQHAQTVHMNEDIPVDSLAATGTRFQRQIRTERMRTPGNRPRASTLSSGGHSRGHSRNVSGSSIGSISDLASPDSARRAPPPLAMATPIQARPGLSVDTFSASTNVPYYNYAPSGFSTPMSAYSNEAGSPRMSSVLGSPIGMMSRSTIGWGGQNHSRRLSVPSQVNPYHPASQFHTPQAPFMSPMMTPAIPHHSMMQTSPPRDGGHQMLDATEAEWRRRTWHPSSRNSFGSRPATSGLSYQQRPDDPQAVPTTQPAAQQAVRLPGIDSFDRSTLHPSATNRRPTEGMDLDDVSVAVETEPSSKRNSWNSMNQNLNHLELAQNTPPRDPNNWRHSNGSNSSLSTRPPTAPYYNSPSRAPAAPMTVNNPHIDAVIDPALEQQPLPIPATPLRKKRQGLFFNEANTSPGAGEPGPAIRTSPDGSANSEEVHTPSANADYQPAIVHSDGHIERQDMPVVEEQPKQGEMAAQASMSTFGVPQVPSAGPETPEQQRSHDTQRLDALVAVATSEDQVIAQH